MAAYAALEQATGQSELPGGAKEPQLSDDEPRQCGLTRRHCLIFGTFLISVGAAFVGGTLWFGAASDASSVETGAASRGTGEEQVLHQAWKYKFVKHSCANAGSAGARRLPQVKAIFDPKFLKGDKLDHDMILPYYGSSNFETDVPSNAKIAMIVVHGAGRNALDYFCTFKDIQNRVDAGSILLIAPKFHYEVDIPKEHELWWNGSQPWGDWRAGAASDARSGATVSSFTIFDDMILQLNDLSKHPLMERILMVGHSAGGQVVQRYAVMSHLKPKYLAADSPDGRLFTKAVRPELDVRYIVANPSTYAYLDDFRWAYRYEADKNKFSEMTYAEYTPKLGPAMGHLPGKHNYFKAGLQSLEKPFVCSSPGFNDWNYGLDWKTVEAGAIGPYLRSHPNLKAGVAHYKDRDVHYFVGQNDTCTGPMLPAGACLSSCWSRDGWEGAPDPKVDPMKCYENHMDSRCMAMLQGPNRNTRGHNYMRHLKSHYGADVHELHVVPGSGHEGDKMLLSEAALKIMFDCSRTGCL